MLFGLAIISVLIAASLGRTAAHVMVLKQAAAGLEADALHQGALTVAGVWIAEQDDLDGSAVRTFSIGSEPVDVRIQDVAGLVDLGAGNIEMVKRVISALSDDSDPQALARLEGLRASKARLQSVGELLRLRLVGYPDYATIAPLMTVFSGRAGVNLSQAPERLRSVMGEGGGRSSSNRLRRGRRLQVVIGSGGRRMGATLAVSGGAVTGARLEAIDGLYLGYPGGDDGVVGSKQSDRWMSQ